MLLLPVETNSAQRQLLWPTDPGIRYELQSSTNLETWTTVDGFPTVADALAKQHLLELQNSEKRFFRVLVLDEQPPVITPQFPVDGAFAVPRFSTISVSLFDTSGVNPASISMEIGDLGTFTVANTQLTYTNNVLTFSMGGDTALGSYGTNILVLLVAADINGHAATNSWEFNLEVAENVETNLFVFGSPVAQRSGQNIGAIPTRILAERINGGPIRMSGADLWELQSVETNRIVLSYTGSSAPVFKVGTKLANLTPANVNAIFYRQITGTSDDFANKLLTLYTEDMSLEHLVTEGSLSASDKSVVLQISTNGAIIRAVSMDFSMTLPRIGFSLDGAEFKVSTDGTQATLGGLTYEYGSPPTEGWDATAGLEFTAEELNWWLTPKLETSLEINFGKLTRFSTIASGHIESAGVYHAAILAGVSYEKTIYNQPVLSQWVYLGNIGPLPVFVEIGVDIKLDADASAQAALQFRYGIRKAQDAAFGVNYENETVNWINVFKESPPEIIPFAVTLNGEVGLGLSVKPRVKALVYGLAGVETGPSFRGGVSVRTENLQLSGYLEGLLTWDLGLAGPAFEYLDPQPSLKLELWSEELKIFPQDADLVFTEHPVSQEVPYGGSAYFSCNVSADQPVSYQWYQNGIILPGQKNRTLLLPSVNSGYAGTYMVRASAGNQTTNSNPAVLTVSPKYFLSAGVVCIPSGRNSGIDPDSGTTYSWSVPTFYMDVTEVTKAQWDDVYNWAIANGYNFDNVGFGKAADHPVHTVNWYDCVKWCNARSQREGRPPCYTVGGSVYKTGQNTNVVCSFSAKGYRLPMMPEWMYATRGGLIGKRFPWGDTITHSQANYFSQSSFSYDISSTRGYHPIYSTSGGSNYTSQVGSFAPNSYGLFDMSGNVREWCFAGGGSLTKPVRGGSWKSRAIEARCTGGSSAQAGSATNDIGFRCVYR
jgi:formylglycine-generating enzyme required for sulfatase activity